MDIWLIKDGEPIPGQSEAGLLRTGRVAAELHRRGHRVTWWASTFAHIRKNLLADRDVTLPIGAHYNVRLLHAGTYQDHVSWRRYLHHRVTAQRFRHHARTLPVPDLIVTGLPTIDLAHAGVEYGRSHRVPVIVDIRDLWPDIFVDKSPRMTRPVVRRLLFNDFRRTRNLLRDATGLIATSEGYLQWGLERAARAMTSADRVVPIGRAPHQPPAAPSERMRDLRQALGNRVVFTFIGTFGYSYDLPLLCEVARRVQDDDRIRFVLAGEGQQYGAIAHAAAGLPNVRLPGWLDPQEVADLLERTDVGLAPCISAKGTMPNKVFDYMAAGLPILSSLEGDMEDLIAKQDVGFSYRCGDANTLERYVRLLADDKALRTRLASNSLHLFQREFEAARIDAIYAEHMELVGGGSS